MKDRQLFSDRKHLRILLIVVLLLGLYFRFVNLERKVFWGDETFTSLAISGHTIADVEKQSLSGTIINIEEVRNQYQKISSKGNFSKTIDALTKDVHPPLYYTLLYWWNSFFGDEIQVTRSLSAVISCLIFPGIYWFCWELFNSSFVASIGVLLIAVSPFHVLYAQEARMYSLWTVTILLSSAALIKAVKNEEYSYSKNQLFSKNLLNWLVYSLTISLGFYTYIFTAFVAISHAIYIFTIEKFRLTKITILYVFASVISLISFLPWLVIMIANKDSFQNATSWASQAMPLSSLLNNWVYNITYVFADFFFFFTYNPNSSLNFSYGKLVIPLVCILIIYALYYLFIKSDLKIWLFVFSLIIVNAVGVILPDLISGGYASIMSRYFIPTYLGIEVSVAYLLANKINSVFMTAKLKKLKFWKIILAVIISAGILSCTISSQSAFWWNKRTSSYDYLQASKIINEKQKPLLIAKDLSKNLILTHILENDTNLLLVNSESKIQIPSSYDSVYLFKPSKDIVQKLEQQNYKLKIAYKGRKVDLWQLE